MGDIAGRSWDHSVQGIYDYAAETTIEGGRITVVEHAQGVLLKDQSGLDGIVWLHTFDPRDTERWQHWLDENFGLTQVWSPEHQRALPPTEAGGVTPDEVTTISTRIPAWEQRGHAGTLYDSETIGASRHPRKSPAATAAFGRISAAYPGDPDVVIEEISHGLEGGHHDLLVATSPSDPGVRVVVVDTWTHPGAEEPNRYTCTRYESGEKLDYEEYGPGEIERLVHDVCGEIDTRIKPTNDHHTAEGSPPGHAGPGAESERKPEPPVDPACLSQLTQLQPPAGPAGPGL